MPTLSEIITKTEAEHTVIMQRIVTLQEAFDRDLARLRDEGLVLARVLELLWQAQAATGAAPATAAQAFDDEAPAPVPEPVKSEPPVRVPTPAPEEAIHPLHSAVGANGFDRMAARRQFRQWHIRYPLARSYRIPSQVMRQAVRAATMDMPNYRDDWLRVGGADLGDATAKITVTQLRDAATQLGVNVKDVEDAAYRLWREVKTYGKRSADYLWEDEA